MGIYSSEVQFDLLTILNVFFQGDSSPLSSRVCVFGVFNRERQCVDRCLCCSSSTSLYSLTQTAAVNVTGAAVVTQQIEFAHAFYCVFYKTIQIVT